MSDTQNTDAIGSRYELRNKLGEGGMGMVYRAFDRLNQNDVALKRVSTKAGELDPSTQGADSTADMRVVLAHEFQTLASLRHPHIISVLDYGFDDERQPFFTMSLLKNPHTITEAGKNQPLENQIKLLIAMLQALAYLHRRDIIHRDLKPDNALVTAEGEVQVLDFGLAVLRKRRDVQQEVAGTLAYLAPEVLQGSPASEASDLYAVGMIAYELFAGRHPFNLDNITLLLQDILMQQVDIDTLDVNPQLAFIVGRLLSKTPEDRYPDAYAVIEALSEAIDQPIPQETAAIRESFLQAAEFVGRNAELKELTTALRDAVDGQGSTWLIGGESGVGKSRLIDELRTRALVQGVIVLRGQAVRQGGIPYQIWRDPLKRLALTTDLSDIDASILKDLVHDIDLLLGRDIAAAPPLEAEAFQQRLLGTIVSLFQRQTTPIVLLLEDLQWTHTSLEVVRALNGIVSEQPLLIVGSYRPEDRPDLVDELPQMQTLHLERLTQDNIAALSVSMLGSIGQRKDVLALLQRETEGNVFFLVEIVRALAEEAGRLQNIGHSVLPERVVAGGIQAIIQRRLERVPKEGQTLLQLAAIAGRELDLEILKQVKGDIDLDDWLTACANVAVLEAKEEQWQFTHDKLRLATLDLISDEDCPGLHRQIAQAIETTYPDFPEQATNLALHWQQAGDEVKERIYRQRAGEYGLHVGSLNSAVQHLGRALELLATSDLPEGEQHNLRVNLLIKLGEALKYTGDYPGAVKHTQAALGLCRAMNVRLGIAQALVELADVLAYQGDYTEAAKLCHEGLSIYRELQDKPGIAHALDRLGTVQLEQGRYDEARQHCQESLALAREVEDQSAIASALNNLGIIANSQGNYADATQHYEEALAISRERGERRRIATALLNLGSVAGEQDDFEGAKRYFLETLETCRAIGERRGVALSLENLGVISEFQEEYTQAQTYYEESLPIYRAIGDRTGIASILLNLGNGARAQKHNNPAKDYYQQALQIAHEVEATPIVMEILVGLAAVETDPTRALVWLGLVLNHSATYESTRKLATSVLEEIKKILPPMYVEAGLEQGKALDLSAVVQDILPSSEEAETSTDSDVPV